MVPQLRVAKHEEELGTRSCSLFSQPLLECWSDAVCPLQKWSTWGPQYPKTSPFQMTKCRGHLRVRYQGRKVHQESPARSAASESRQISAQEPELRAWEGLCLMPNWVGPFCAYPLCLMNSFCPPPLGFCPTPFFSPARSKMALLLGHVQLVPPVPIYGLQRPTMPYQIDPPPQVATETVFNPLNWDQRQWVCRQIPLDQIAAPPKAEGTAELHQPFPWFPWHPRLV